MTIRVVVVVADDDQQIVREGFAALQDDITVVGRAADGEEAVRLCGEQQRDVVLKDVRMPGVDGIEATRRLAGARVIILTTFDLDDDDALSAGAGGFLLKDAGAERLSELMPRETEVLRLVAEGLSNTEIADRLALSDETVKTTSAACSSSSARASAPRPWSPPRSPASSSRAALDTARAARLASP